jgi:putative hydrolase of the HAD superfamily
MRCVIFDLDNCLAASDEGGVDLAGPVFGAIREANQGTLSLDALEAALRDLWLHSMDVVAETHGFSEPMRAAGWKACSNLEVTRPMRGYGDLALIPQLGELRFLVTTGFRRLQESKVRALGIASYFDAVVIDAIDEPDHPGKQRIFADLMASHGLERHEVLVVGDNPESELAAARALGLRAVQILRPRVVRTDDVPKHVADLRELRALIDATV